MTGNAKCHRPKTNLPYRLLGNLSRTPDRDFRCFFPCEIIISHIYLYQSVGKIKKRTAARWPHVPPWRHCNVKMTSPCLISAYFKFSGNPFHGLFHYKSIYLVVSKKKNPLFVWWWDRKICPSWSPSVITQQASWCQSLILGMDFSIPHSWFILILEEYNARKAASTQRNVY